MDDDEAENPARDEEPPSGFNDIENRDYQDNMVDESLKGNIICSLGTGMGKTQVAVSVIRSLLYQIEPAWNEGGKRTVMVVPSVNLVEQQTKYLQRWIPFSVKGFHGNSIVELWTKEAWEPEFKNNCVLVMIHDILKALLQHALLDISRINLLVMDECHHAVKDHPYREIMRYINDRPLAERPLILGLTASVVDCKIHSTDLKAEMETLITSLEKCLNAKVCTSDDESIKDYEAKPTVTIETYKEWSLDQGDSELYEDVHETLNHMVRWLQAATNHAKQLEKDAKINRRNVAYLDSGTDERFRLSYMKSASTVQSAFVQLSNTLDTLGPWCAYQAASMVKKDLELMVQTACFHNKLIYAVMGAVSQLHMFATLLEIKFKVHKIARGDVDGLLHVSSPKLRKLVDILLKNKPTGKEINALDGLRCIVFVKPRFDAWSLHKFFEFLAARPDGEFRHVKAGYLVGQVTCGSPGDTPHRVALSYRQSQGTLEKFRRGKINVLIATKVFEEGLDVPHCNLIIRFDKIETYCSYLQSKGRARARDSKFVVLSSEEQLLNTESDLRTFTLMDEIAKQTCINRIIPPFIAQRQHFDDKPIPPFSPPGTRAVVTLGSALSLLRRYCNTLPNDRSCSGVVHGQFLDTGDPKIFVYRMYMSLSSVIKRPITGPPMRSRKLAKQATALDCCKALYELGQFDDNLLPFEKNWRNDLSFIMGGHEREVVPEGLPTPGTKRRRQYYRKKEAVLLHHSRPVSDQPLYLYAVMLKLVHTFQSDALTRFTLDPSSSVGLLSRVKIPPIPPFQAYLHHAEYQIEIQPVSSTVVLSNQDIDSLQKFHCAVYDQVLQFCHNIAIHFTPDFDNEAILAVPLKPDGSVDCALVIDWETVEKTKDPGQYCVISQPDETRKRKKIRPEDYVNGVLVRWYKADSEDDRFLVLDVRQDMNPLTQCRMDEFNSFQEYFGRKYGIEIQQLNQPIVETKFAGRQMNVLRCPVEDEENGKAARVQSRRAGGLMLVPELCQLFPMKAALYSKCMIMTSVMHRLHWFCQTFELYLRFRAELGVGANLPIPETWPPLTYTCRKMAVADAKPSIVQSGREILGPTNGYSERVQELKDNSAPSSSKTPPLDSDLESTAELPDEFGLLYDSYDRQRRWILQSRKQRLENKEICVTTKRQKQLRDDVSVPMDFAADGWPKQTPYQVFGCASHLTEAPFPMDSQFHVDTTRVALPDLNQLLNALTTSKAVDGFDLERLEVIGDSFLKLTSYTYMFFRFPQHQEGRLTQLCDQQVSNYNLYRLAREKGLESYIINQLFEPRETFVPPGYIFDEEESDMILANSGTKADKFPSPRVHQGVEDKTVADVVEAMIGTFLINSSARSAQLFMSWIGLHVLPEIANSTVDMTAAERFGAFTASNIQSPVLRNDPDAQIMLKRLSAGLGEFEQRIGYKFKNIAFLVQAFTHSSYDPNEITDCYQRLEFLGDALIDFLVTRYVFEDIKSHDPGVMSDIRSALVNNRTFSTLALKYNYHNHIKFRSPRLYNLINTFVEEVQEKNQDVLPLEEDMLFTNFDDQLEPDEDGYEEAEAPKALGDVFEAVAGAIFLDSGLSLDTVWKVYYNIMRPQIESFVQNCPRNPIRELMELEGPKCRFGAIETLGNGRCSLQVTVLGKGTFTGRGNNYRAAKCNAAKAALMVLKKT